MLIQTSCIHMYMLSSFFGLCNYYLKREGSVMFVVILCILFCGFCESIYMCALQYCRQLKSINEKFYFTVLSHDRQYALNKGYALIWHITTSTNVWERDGCEAQSIDQASHPSC